MNCPSCSTDNGDDYKFCASCGALLAQEDEAPGATRTGLNQNVAALLCYVLGWVTGLIFILLEKRNEYVRFHAMQSIVTFGAFTAMGVLLWLLGLIPYIGILFDILGWLLLVLAVILWALLMVESYQGERYVIPWFGDFAERETYGRTQVEEH